MSSSTMATTPPLTSSTHAMTAASCQPETQGKHEISTATRQRRLAQRQGSRRQNLSKNFLQATMSMAEARRDTRMTENQLDTLDQAPLKKRAQQQQEHAAERAAEEV
eukprot:g51549.t1